MEFATEWRGQIADGRFPLEQYLGGSDQQAVYLTHVPDGGQKAAIKLVRANVCDPEQQLAAWERAAKFSHPHLIRILDCGRCWLSGHDLLFVITEYAEENLGQVIPQRALTQAETESMLRETTDALVFLHAQGLVHGHVRPSNVMAVNDQVKLSSDGIQAPGASLRVLDPSEYDAPELVSRQLSTPADIWSVGKVVVAALTQRTNTKPERLNLPQPFAEVVRHTVVPEPRRRWKIGEVQARMRPAAAIVGASSVKDRELPGGVQSRGPMMVGVALLVAAIIAAVMFMHHGPSATQPASAPNTATTGAAEVPEVQPSLADSPGSALSRVLPQPSRSALDTIQGHLKVRIKVDVNAAGNVTNATFLNPGPSHYFSRLAMQAAERWKFAPKIRNGQTTTSEWNLLFTYSRGGVQASEQAVRTR